MSNYEILNRYYGYLDAPIAPAYCSSNGLHNDLHKKGVQRGIMISFTEPLKTFRSVNIRELSADNSTLDLILAEYNTMELRRAGLDLPINFAKSKKTELIASYILNSSLCWVSTTTKNGSKSFFATKNPFIFSSLSSLFAESEYRKKTCGFAEQFTTTFSEITTGKFQIISLIFDNGGFRIGKATINCKSEDTTIVPMYVIGNYIDSICNYLSNNKVIITYTEDSKEKSFVTTLNPIIIQQWTKSKDINIVNSIIDKSQNPFIYGQLILPNLYKFKDFVTLHVLSITSIRKIE
jgi:hypothetical protein